MRTDRDRNAACWAVAAWRTSSRRTPRRFVRKRNDTLPPRRIGAERREMSLPLR